MANKIKQLREEAGLSQVALGEQCNTTGQNIGLIERGARRLNDQMMRKIARALNVHPADLLDLEEDDSDAGAKGLGRLADASPPLATAERANVPPPNPSQWPRSLPIRGSAAGSNSDNGAMRLDDSQIGYVRRPPGLQGANDAYAVYVVGDSMAPRFFEGHLLFVHPRQPARPGDDIILQVQKDEHSEIEAFVKMLVRKNSKEIVVEQFNPARTLTFKMAQIVAIHRVMPSNELVGF